ncbi:hypothetical protein TSOC_004090 [Tetrabaena socialis]|uniref:DUF202 domain-containing protein n=1 Tax=Tetrabaena socialis TaxID=47790 RepID=A0A2J8A9X1_9CHLO|nr:hypothetical protein TSOC_004090 [Tetrabaena socialis]|eukprot:PNH09283.1 hypothetical protein TSOC_004090 [Tetrabaena socialis]
MLPAEPYRNTVDAKVYLANERTFLTWMRQAVLMGGIGAALSGLAAYQGAQGQLAPGPHGPLAAVVQLKLAGGALLLTAAAMSLAAGRNFFRRGQMIRRAGPAGEPSDSRGWYSVWLPRLLTGSLSLVMAAVWVAALLRLLPERDGTAEEGGAG